MKDLGLVEVMLLGSSITHLMSSGAGVREEEYYKELSNLLELRLFQYFPSTTIDWNAGPAPYRNKWIHSTIGALRYSKFYRSGSVRIVRSKQLWGSWAGWLLAVMLGKPHVLRCGYIWSRSFVIERGITGLLRVLIEKFEIFVLKRADYYIFCSRDIENFYKPYIGAKPYIVLPNYVDKNHFYPEPSIDKVDQFLFLGRFIELKGVREAAYFISQQDIPERSTFIGQGPLQDVVVASGARVIPKLPNDQLRAFMISHKYFISFSKTEGSPKALLEAVFCGLVPILSDIPVHREIVCKLGYGMILKKVSDFRFDLPECIVDYEKLRLFMTEFSIEKHISTEIEFLKECANVSDDLRV